MDFSSRSQMYTSDAKETGILQANLTPALFGTRAPSRVLVLDDDPLTAQLLTSIGKREGFQVVSVDDSRKAYRMLKSDAGFTAAVLNMTMPHLNGVDIIRYMKTEKRLMRIPVVIIAGEHGLKLIADSFAAGALLFLPKPFTTDKLARAIRLAISSGRLQPTELHPA